MAERRLAAIMFTDIVGYTALMARDEEAARAARDRHEAVVRPLVERYGGQWIERTGDETLSSFPSALDAVNCALAAQAELDGDADLQLRIGIHHGDVTFDAEGVAGGGVNIAARVRPFAAPGGIAISDDVHGSVQGRRHLEFKSLGPQDLKHVPGPVTIYAVSGEAEPAPEVSRAVAILAQPELHSIAVLPLENVGPSENEHVADGVTDALIESLARVGPELRVISRTSVMQYKGTRKTAREIARELGVGLLVEGTALREDDDVLVRLQLIDAERDAHLWAQSYERKFGGVLRLGREIACAVAGEIGGVLKPEREPLLGDTRPVEPEVLDLYLRARALRGSAELSITWGPPAIELLERSVALDPRFADGWVALAHDHFLLGVVGLGTASRDELVRAREAADRALALDESLGAAHAMDGLVRLFLDWDFSGSKEKLARALELSPSDPLALNCYSVHLRLVGLGASPEGELVIQRLLRTAPFDPYYRAERLKDLYYSRQYERALSEIEQIREFDPHFADLTSGATYGALGRLDDAAREYRACFERGGAAFDTVRAEFERGIGEGGFLGGIYAWRDVWIGEATRGASGLGCNIAVLAPSKTEEAFAWLEHAYNERDPLLLFIKVHQGLDPLRSDPRFEDLVRRVGFPDAERDCGALADAGYAFALGGHSAEAIASLEQAMELGPRDPRLPRWFYYMALAHFGAERYEIAADWARRAIQLGSGDHVAANAYLLLATSYAQLGDADQARQAMNDALVLWPGLTLDVVPLPPVTIADLRERYVAGLRTAGLEE